ncbi:hypothetical protein [Carboxylicivirga marina]|uniref:hypothetical protein n=1 Tax=Carboxylicivirga marina TaxID=2800988 RepID=UPI002596CDC5|nr:hypothetical protein [uncultured Carboxylicivirga sp.]
MKQLRRYFLTIIVVLAANVCHSQEKKDNTGTNPANFTYDTRFYSEMAELPNAAGSYLTNFFEFRWPLGKDLAKASGVENDHMLNNLGKKFGTRMRFRYKDLNINSPEGAFSNSNVSGIGDMDLRLLWMAYASSKMIIVPGLEATFNTASHETLGFNANVLAPTLFFVFPGLLGKGSLFAPGYQYLFDMDGGDNNKISRSQIDLYFVWLLGKGANWLIIDPQVIVDHDTDKFPALVEVEYGYMIKALPGASVYVRPGAGIGSDRPYDWNCEFGLKFIWR